MQQAPFLPVELYGVIGWPLGQSLSPLIHNTAFQALGRDAVYLRWEIAPERLAAFVDSFRLLRMRGCSVTIPHKVAIMPYLDAVSASAQAVGAVNTLYWQDDALCGENTDVTGFMAPLLERALPKDTPVLLLGAGGAARAAAAGLRAHGFSDCTVCTPSDRTHVPLAEAFDIEASELRVIVGERGDGTSTEQERQLAGQQLARTLQRLFGEQTPAEAPSPEA